MADMSSIGAALGALKAAKDIAESMIGLRDAAAFQGKMLEFQSKIIDANNAAFAAQDERSALLEEIGELKKQVAEFEAWESEKQRYQLHKIAPGSYAYLLKRPMANGEPCHALCTSCYDKGIKSTLQSNGSPFINKHLISCPTCRMKIQISPSQIPDFQD